MIPAVYDAGALLAAERKKSQMLTQHAELLRLKIKPVVPTVVLAQVWRGGPQPRLSELLKGCDIRPCSEATARLAGTTCAAAKTTDVVDAIVVTTAVTTGSRVFTSDPVDLKHLADSINAKLQMRVV